MPKPIDISGLKFGRLLVLKETGKRLHGCRVWLCSCDCGTAKESTAYSLTSGMTKSCGCLNRDSCREVGRNNRINGNMTRTRRIKTPTYRSWQSMLYRCSNPKAASWNCYGGRGIKVCERWKKFDNFLADMGERPVDMTLDRYPNNDGNYEPGNCRWATLSQQALNQRPRRYLKKRKCSPLSEAHKAKLSAAHLGKKLSPEHRAKVSMSMKAAYAEGRR